MGDKRETFVLERCPSLSWQKHWHLLMHRAWSLAGSGKQGPAGYTWVNSAFSGNWELWEMWVWGGQSKQDSNRWRLVFLKEYAGDDAVIYHSLDQKDYRNVFFLVCVFFFAKFHFISNWVSRTQEVPKTRRLAFLTTRSRRDPDPGKSVLNAYLVLISDIIIFFSWVYTPFSSSLLPSPESFWPTVFLLNGFLQWQMRCNSKLPVNCKTLQTREWYS